jgi:LuxR family transcriptional regulator of csgAB operon
MGSLAMTGGYVVGSQRLVNELLVDCLSRQTPLTWIVLSRLVELPPGEDPRLVLWDVQQISIKRITNDIEMSCLNTRQDALALFNLFKDQGIEEPCLSSGVRAFFYVDDSLEWIQKGVSALLEGQVWLSPESIGTPGVATGGLPTPWNILISRREWEALELVVQGRTNQEIAEAMSISPHTVKTHLYKLYKKIEVSSRLEAVIWYRTVMAR